MKNLIFKTVVIWKLIEYSQKNKVQIECGWQCDKTDINVCTQDCHLSRVDAKCNAAREKMRTEKNMKREIKNRKI